jgi:hypothetical protein
MAAGWPADERRATFDKLERLELPHRLTPFGPGRAQRGLCAPEPSKGSLGVRNLIDLAVPGGSVDLVQRHYVKHLSTRPKAKFRIDGDGAESVRSSLASSSTR